MDNLVFKSLMAKDKPTVAEIKALPKIVLHEHLDGGLRPATIIEIAQEIGYVLPTTNLGELEKWFYDNCNSGSLVRYLQCFDITIAMMQRRQDLVRIARECVEDLADDGVIYAEIRYAPELFQNDVLDTDIIVEAINEGFAQGMELVNSNNSFSLAHHKQQNDNNVDIDPSKAKYLYPIKVRSLLCAMRQHSNAVAERIAQLAIKYRDQCIAGFDIAGPENGFPPRRHASAFDKLRRENMHFTIHAGEDFGLPSIWEAIQICGSDRLGHGVRIVDDIIDTQTQLPVDMTTLPVCPTSDDIKRFSLGRLASYVRDKRIALEVCPTSNLQTGCVPTALMHEHPIHLLHLLRYRVTVNTDNRLMSGTTMTRELSLMVDTFHWTFADIQRVTINAIKSAFTTFDERVYLIKQIIKPSFKDLVAKKHGAISGSFSEKLSHSGQQSVKYYLRNDATSTSGHFFTTNNDNNNNSTNTIEGLTDGSDRLVIDNIPMLTAEEVEAMSEGEEDDESIDSCACNEQELDELCDRTGEVTV